MIYCVITDVPEPKAGKNGNVYFPDALFLVNHNQTKVRPMSYTDLAKDSREFGVAIPLFTEGEIVLVDERDGYELVGQRRNLRDSNVAYEAFSKLEKAIERASEITDIAQEDFLSGFVEQVASASESNT